MKFKKKFFLKIYPRKLDWLDLILIKLSVLCVGFFLITVSNKIFELIFKVHWAWFLALAVLFSYRPLVKSEYVKED